MCIAFYFLINHFAQFPQRNIYWAHHTDNTLIWMYHWIWHGLKNINMLNKSPSLTCSVHDPDEIQNFLLQQCSHLCMTWIFFYQFCLCLLDFMIPGYRILEFFLDNTCIAIICFKIQNSDIIVEKLKPCKIWTVKRW